MQTEMYANENTVDNCARTKMTGRAGLPYCRDFANNQDDEYNLYASNDDDKNFADDQFDFDDDHHYEQRENGQIQLIVKSGCCTSDVSKWWVRKPWYHTHSLQTVSDIWPHHLPLILLVTHRRQLLIPES